MMRYNLIAGLATIFAVSAASAADGLNSLASAHSVADTTSRLEQAVSDAGFRVFARIDHAAGARTVEMPLAPTELLIFGDPKGGTALMQSARTIGIDLPLKYLVWKDADGTVMIGWNDPDWLASRHGITDRAPVIDKVNGALQAFASEAAKP